MIFQGVGGTSWITTNCGESISIIHHGSTLIKFQFHPTQRTWILALSKTKCPKRKSKTNSDRPKKVNLTPQPKNCKELTQLMVTLDLSENWKNLIDNVAEFSW